MRKTSQDGGDTTSITSGIDNEAKKSISGIAKIKKSSIKKKVQGYSHESDDGVGEPLLQKDKEKPEFPNQSAKYLLSKAKTDSANEKMDDRDMLLPDNVIEKPAFTSFSGKKNNLSNGKQEGFMPYVSTSNPIHNHMHINVFSSPEGVKSPIVPKTQVLIAIDGNKQSSFNSTGPLIFTTAKIHTDGKAMHMEPVQVTPVPILSTVEGSVIKTSSVSENDRKNIGTTSIKNIEPKMITGLPKITSDEINPLPLALPLKMYIPQTSTDSKTTNSYSTELKISAPKIQSNTTPKDITPTAIVKPGTSTLDKCSQSLKEITKSKVSDINSIGDIQEMDVNKNFQTGPSRSNITTTVITTTSTSTKTSKPIVTNAVVGKPTISSDKFTTAMTTTSKNETSIVFPSAHTGNTTKSNAMSMIASESTVKGSIPASLESSTTALSKTTTASTLSRAESVKVTPGLTTNTPVSAKTTFTMSNATPNPPSAILPNKEVPKHQETITKLPVSTTSRTPILTVSSSTKSLVPQISSAGKIAITTGKPVTITSAMVAPTAIKPSVSTTMTTEKTAMTSKPVSTAFSSAKTSTTISSVKPQSITSSGAAISAKVSPSATKIVPSVASLPSTTASSHIKSPASTTNSVVTTDTESLTSISKPISSTVSSTPTTTSYAAKSSAPITCSNLTSSGNPLKSTSKLISTTASSTITAQSLTTKCTTTPSSGSKNTSSITPSMISSTSGPSTILTNKLSKGNDKPKDDVKVKSSVAPASTPAKPSAADVSKTQNISSSSGTVTTVKSATSKVLTQTPTPKTGSSQTKASTKPASVPIAAASNQTSKPPAINKSNELQSNEHKKEKLKK